MRSDTNSESPAPESPLEAGFLTLTEATREVPGRPHLSTLHRWRLRGVRGVRLRTCLVGGRRFTRREWLKDFIERSSEAGDAGFSNQSKPSAKREASIRAAEAELDAAGI